MVVARAEQLVALTKAIFAQAGSNDGEALAIARNLVAANLAGHDSHGVGMTPRYIGNLRRGVLYANQHARVSDDNGTIVRIDGNLGYGQVIGAECMEIGVARARETGVAILALRNSHHLGRIGAWGEICAEAGLISIHYVNAIAHVPLVAPYGGAEARYATNPYCTAIPGTDGRPPIILDMATSTVAMGKVRVAYNKGVDMPEGCLIGPNGAPTNDPAVMFREPRGALLPIGAYKGYGLALVAEILAGALTNGGTCLPARQTRDTIVNNMLSIILDPAAIGEASLFEREVAEMTDYVKSARPADGVDEVMVPGDPERKARAERGANGIPIDERTWQEILDTAELVGLGAATAAAMVVESQSQRRIGPGD